MFHHQSAARMRSDRTTSAFVRPPVLASIDTVGIGDTGIRGRQRRRLLSSASGPISAFRFFPEDRLQAALSVRKGVEHADAAAARPASIPKS